MAKPFGPKNNAGNDAFEADVNAKLGAYTCHYSDDWDLYHNWEGEVHCATNVKRIPHSAKWWE